MITVGQSSGTPAAAWSCSSRAVAAAVRRRVHDGSADPAGALQNRIVLGGGLRAAADATRTIR